jgi:hypothetical protein
MAFLLFLSLSRYNKTRTIVLDMFIRVHNIAYVMFALLTLNEVQRSNDFLSVNY